MSHTSPARYLISVASIFFLQIIVYDLLHMPSTWKSELVDERKVRK